MGKNVIEKNNTIRQKCFIKIQKINFSLIFQIISNHFSTFFMKVIFTIIGLGSLWRHENDRKLILTFGAYFQDVYLELWIWNFTRCESDSLRFIYVNFKVVGEVFRV